MTNNVNLEELMGGAESIQQIVRTIEMVEAMKKGDVTTKNPGVERKDDLDQIHIPVWMRASQASEVLADVAAEEERMVEVHHVIPCFPFDGARAFHLVLNSMYNVVSKDTPSFWGNQPPNMVGIETGPEPGDREQVLWGRVNLSIFDKNEFLDTSVSTPDGEPPALVIHGEVRRKNEDTINKIVAATREYLRSNSVYRGKALRLNLDWRHKDESRFDPRSHVPKFMRTPVSMDNVILDEQARSAIEANIIARLRQTKRCRDAGMNPSIAALFTGTYGTGKSLTAAALAKEATDAGWTFLYLEAPRRGDIEYAANVAEMFDGVEESGVVLFVEDIDSVVGKGRSRETDSLLNLLDGINGKDTNFICIFTTNHDDRITMPLRRAGRISTYVKFLRPHGNQVIEFVRLYGGDRLIEDADYSVVVEPLAGMTPAFIKQVVDQALLYVIAADEGGDNIDMKLTPESIVKSANDQRLHMEYAEGITDAEVLQQVDAETEVMRAYTDLMAYKTAQAAAAGTSYAVGGMLNELMQMGGKQK